MFKSKPGLWVLAAALLISAFSSHDSSASSIVIRESPFQIHPDNALMDRKPAAAYSTASQQFLVVWERESNIVAGTYDIMGHSVKW